MDRDEQPNFFTMTGDEATVWALGRPVGTIQGWTLRALNAEEFTLTCRSSHFADGIVGLPDSLRPPLELRLPLGRGSLAAPIRLVDVTHFRGMARPTFTPAPTRQHENKRRTP